jgi:hypothetical protein
MWIHLIIGVLVGAVLGLRFKVAVLFLAIGLASTILIAIAIVGGDGLMGLVAAVVTVSMAILLGYVCGVVCRLASIESVWRYKR